MKTIMKSVKSMKKMVEKTKLISVRYSMQQYLQIESTAEEKHIEKVELLRNVWNEAYSMSTLNNQIKEMEIKLKRDIFEILSAVAGLDSIQKKETLNTLLKLGVIS